MESRFRGHDLSPQFHSDKRHIILEKLAQLPLYVVFLLPETTVAVFIMTHTHTAVTPRPLTDIIQRLKNKTKKSPPA